MEDISIYERLVLVSCFTFGFCARCIIDYVVEKIPRVLPGTRMRKQLERISAQLDSLPSPQSSNELMAKVNELTTKVNEFMAKVNELEGVSSKREKKRKATPPNVSRHINGAA